MIHVVLVRPARRFVVGLPHRRDHALLVGEVALHGADRGVDQHDAVVALRTVEDRRLAVLLPEVRHVLLVRLVLEVRAPVARLELAERGFLHRRQRDLVDRVHGVERDLAAQAGLRVLLEELDAHAARIEDEHRLRVGRAELADLGLIVLLPELGVDLAHDLVLEVALEPRDHVLAGRVVRRHRVDVGDVLVLHVLAHRLGRLVVLPRRREEELVAHLAGELVRPGVRADHESAGARHGGRHRQHHVRPDDARDEMDLVLLEHLVGELLADVGLDLVVAVDHLDVEPADLSSEMVERQLDRILHVLADDPLWPGQGGDEADLHRLGGRRSGGQRHEESDEESFRSHDRDLQPKRVARF